MPLSSKILFVEVIVSTFLVITLILLAITKRKGITSHAFLKRTEDKKAIAKTILYLAVIAIFIFVNTEVLEFVLPYFKEDYSIFFGRVVKAGHIMLVFINTIAQALFFYLLLGIWREESL